ncbi:30S ribosomal protein S20, partial [Corynebacterium bovis]
MANIKQQKKRVLTNEIRRRRNQAIRSRLRTEHRKF